ncbi:MAG: PQQ-binding-like beta-propeller repeat protein [Candidatus Pacebacteria bacterium]|nr:PQQ-binding-like beta-propeller repeat protein [Candidatus Paceibacterota bacterium]
MDLTKRKIILLIIFLTSFFTFVESVSAQASSDWYMAGANQQRTSWVSEEVKGFLSPRWYVNFHPWINTKIQPIGSHGLIYVSTARGLYALNANNGNVAWVYPTEMALGHSPTIVGDVLYVGGYDKKIHAIRANPNTSSLPVDSKTGYRINNQIVWIFNGGEAGFETNPLVVDGSVYAGNRDGYFYALNASNGNLKWKYKTNGPILFSAAYKDGVIYLASNDAHAYALNTNGSLKWKSAKLPIAGFYSFWPVVYTDHQSGRDYVIFTSAHNYLADGFLRINEVKFDYTELVEVFHAHGCTQENQLCSPLRNEPYPGGWVSGTQTMDLGFVSDYFTQKPYRRTYLVLRVSDGADYTADGYRQPPFLWGGSTHSGSKYPPMVGSDNVLYQYANYLGDQYIAEGRTVGWKFGTSIVSRIAQSSSAIDELYSVAGGGDLSYFQHWESEAGAFNYVNGGEEIYYQYGDNFPSGCGRMYPDWVAYGKENEDGAINGVYGGPQSPPIPYNGKVYLFNSNCLLALERGGSANSPLATIQPVESEQDGLVFNDAVLEQKLTNEIQKMIDSGHLRPGYHGSTQGDWMMASEHDYLNHYFSNPGETIYTLLLALDVLRSKPIANNLRNYIQQEYNAYPPHSIAHIGWNSGAKREAYDTLPNVQSAMNNFGSLSSTGNHWRLPPFSVYALWLYAREFGNANQILNQVQNKLDSPPTNDFANYPFVHNAYIAGYIGYCKLEELANTGSNNQGIPQGCSKQSTLNNLLSSRVSGFDKNNHLTGWHDYFRAFTGSRNFMFMVPELADYMNQHILGKVNEAVDEYNYYIPGWFVSKYDSTFEEGMIQYLYDYPALFQAKAYILKQSREELSKYLDVPAFERGDLFYIQNLIAAIKASSSSPPVTPTPSSCSANVNNDGSVGMLDFLQVIGVWGNRGARLVEDINNDGKVNIIDLGRVIKEWGSNC